MELGLDPINPNNNWFVALAEITRRAWYLYLDRINFDN